MSVRWEPPALSGVTIRTVRSCAAVIRATSSALMVLPVTVRDALFSDYCSMDLFFFWSHCELIKNTCCCQTSTSAATPATCVSTSASTSPGSSPVCVQRDTSCWAAACVRVSFVDADSAFTILVLLSFYFSVGSV